MIFGGNRALLAVTVGALVVSLTGCVNFGGPADPASGGMLECERRGEPCTLAEASPEALALTRVITGVAADYLGAGVEPRVVAAEVAMVPGVVETGSDELGVFFRVENAPPAWVMLDELDGNPVMGGWFGAAPTGSAAATVANPIAVNRPVVIPTTMAPTVVSPAARTETQAGGGGIAGTPGEGKHALVLSPWGFEMTNEVGARLAADRDFSERGGSVTTLLWDETIDPV
ncbi:MAG TPA: hypothetical protein PK781_02715, partial [Terrimesophilobacter sp.]|nr:hypothetical protein [Terrimesophilobacter sp.]